VYSLNQLLINFFVEYEEK